MKKSLIALAAVAASGAAMAQSSVTLYGVVDTSVAYVKGKESVSGLLNNGAAASRLGFRGVEDLGNGLKAEFVLEGAVQPDDGSGAKAGAGFNFQRQSTVGLIGDFGQVRLGRALTASYNAVSRYDVFGTNGLGSTLAWNEGYANRADNMISYISPKFAGFGVGIDYGFGEQEKNRTDRYIGIGATYDNGPMSFGLGYDQQNNIRRFNDPDTGVSFDTDLKTWQLGGSYDFGVAKVAAFYADSKFKAVEGSTSIKLKTWNLGVSAPVGAAGVVKAAYNNYKWSNSAGKAQQLSLGYVHNLSKRTSLYGTYAYLKNKNFSDVSEAAGINEFGLNKAFPAVDGANNSGKMQGIQIGVRHAF